VFTLNRAIPPDGSVLFTFEGQPWPRRADGHFETKVSVLGLTRRPTAPAAL